jgi:hypothetical protein
MGAALQADGKGGLRWGSHKHQMEKRSMKHYAGLDVSVKETSIWIVDETGKLCREVKVVSHPEDLVQALKDPAQRLERVGLERSLSQWLFSGLRRRVCRSSASRHGMRKPS